jgi:hypothetical protein
MDNKTYLVRAFAVAILLWGSVAAVVIVAQRPAFVAQAPSQPAQVAVSQ